MDFSYDHNNEYGPLNWFDVDVEGNEWTAYNDRDDVDLDIEKNQCSSTRRPSPVNLVANNDCGDTHEIITPKMQSTSCLLEDLDFTIEPHSLRAHVPTNECKRPWIDLPNGFPGRWYLWYVEVKIRSEHVMDGRRFDGEVMFVHGENPDRSDDLAIVSFMLDASGVRDEPEIQSWIDEWQSLHDTITEKCASEKSLSNEDRNHHSKVHTRVKDEAFFAQLQSDIKEETTEMDLRMFNGRRLKVRRPKPFPYSLWPTIWYYRYDGALTTPPCSEIVNWRVFDEPLKISRKQFKQLSSLVTSYKNDACTPASTASFRGDTFRPLQLLNKDTQDKTVHCTIDNFKEILFDEDQL